MLHTLFPLVLTIAGVLSSSVVIYFAIRFFAYKRAFPLPRKFDFLWIINTLLLIFLSSSAHPPLEGNLSHKLLTWSIFFTFLLSCYLLIFVIDQFLVEYFLVSVSKIYVSPPLRKVLVLFVFVLAVLVGTQKIFHFNPLAYYGVTSALSLGIGLAIKDAFQTFFAGLALSAIIRIGDWIKFNDKEGAVMDINWARTILRTWEGAYLFVPNSELQKGLFWNFSYRENRYRCRLEIGASYDAPPQKVKRVLLECVQNIEGVVSEPAPELLLLNYADFAIQYALTFWIKDYARWRELSSEVSTRIWYAFKREHIAIPFPIRTVQVVRKGKEESQLAELETLLSHIDLFKMLSGEERQLILARLQKQVYLKGEMVVREGKPGSSFYIVLKGRLEVFRQMKEGKLFMIGELKSGQFFGELSLLTGEPRSATVRALSDSELLRLDKKDFQEILERHPELAENLAEVVAARQSTLLEINKNAAEPEPAAQAQPRALSRKIREFFNLKERV